MLTIPAVRKLKEEDYCALKVSLDYIVTSRPGWASEGDPASKLNLILSPVIL